jgi:hypothetical protein
MKTYEGLEVNINALISSAPYVIPGKLRDDVNKVE